MAFSYTTITFTSGQTLTHTLLNQLQTNITNGTVTIAANSITNSMLALPHAYFVIDVPLNAYIDTANGIAGVAAANACGLMHSLSSVDFPFEVPVDCYLLEISTNCVAALDTAAGSNDARIRQNGADVAGTTTLWATGATTTTTLGTAVNLLRADTLFVRVNTATTAGDGVHGASVQLHCRAVHVSD